MSIEYGSEIIAEIKAKLTQKGIDLENRVLEFGSRTDVIEGEEVHILTVHIPKSDGLPGPVYDVEALLQG